MKKGGSILKHRTLNPEWPEGAVELGFITEEEQKKFCTKLTRVAMYGGINHAPRLFTKKLSKHLTKETKMTKRAWWIHVYITGKVKWMKLF